MEENCQRTRRPQQHHRGRQPLRLLPAPIVPYLRHQLDTPENCANRAEYICRDGDVLALAVLVGHGTDVTDKKELSSDGDHTEPINLDRIVLEITRLKMTDRAAGQGKGQAAFFFFFCFSEVAYDR